MRPPTHPFLPHAPPVVPALQIVNYSLRSPHERQRPPQLFNNMSGDEGAAHIAGLLARAPRMEVRGGRRLCGCRDCHCARCVWVAAVQPVCLSRSCAPGCMALHIAHVALPRLSYLSVPVHSVYRPALLVRLAARPPTHLPACPQPARPPPNCAQDIRFASSRVGPAGGIALAQGLMSGACCLCRCGAWHIEMPCRVVCLSSARIPSLSLSVTLREGHQSNNIAHNSFAASLDPTCHRFAAASTHPTRRQLPGAPGLLRQPADGGGGPGAGGGACAAAGAAGAQPERHGPGPRRRGGPVRRPAAELRGGGGCVPLPGACVAAALGLAFDGSQGGCRIDVRVVRDVGSQ